MPKTYQKLTAEDFGAGDAEEVMSQAEVLKYFGSRQRIFKDFRAAGWLKPFNETKGHKRKVGTFYYRRSDVIKAWQRFLDGEYPGRAS